MTLSKLLNSRLIILAVILCSTLYGCTTSPYYQKQYAIDGAAWNSNFQPEFALDIKDTTGNYRAYFIIRHDEAFPFSNIWLRLYVQIPGSDNFIPTERVDMLLATPQGKWLGRNIGDIWEQKKLIPIDINQYITQPGTYRFRLEQIMRMNPLPSVLNVGLNVERL